MQDWAYNVCLISMDKFLRKVPFRVNLLDDFNFVTQNRFMLLDIKSSSSRNAAIPIVCSVKTLFVIFRTFVCILRNCFYVAVFRYSPVGTRMLFLIVTSSTVVELHRFC
jgi:hypothetical protein